MRWYDFSETTASTQWWGSRNDLFLTSLKTTLIMKSESLEAAVARDNLLVKYIFGTKEAVNKQGIAMLNLTQC